MTGGLREAGDHAGELSAVKAEGSVCIVCGAPISAHASRYRGVTHCRSCARKERARRVREERRGLGPRCATCGRPITGRGKSPLCWMCWRRSQLAVGSEHQRRAGRARAGLARQVAAVQEALAAQAAEIERLGRAVERGGTLGLYVVAAKDENAD